MNFPKYCHNRTQYIVKINNCSQKIAYYNVNNNENTFTVLYYKGDCNIREMTHEMCLVLMGVS